MNEELEKVITSKEKEIKKTKIELKEKNDKLKLEMCVQIRDTNDRLKAEASQYKTSLIENQRKAYSYGEKKRSI
jgi:hypothetical protein